MATIYLKTSTAEIELSPAEFGNADSFSINQAKEYTDSGQTYVYQQGYPVWRFSLSLTGLTHEERESLYAFFRTNVRGSLDTFSLGLTTDSSLKDWPTVRWIHGCRFARPSLEFLERLDATYDVALEIERIGTSTGDEIRLPSGYKVS